jgi:hypothetical protein
VNGNRRVEKLRADHPVQEFDCGREELNRYLQRYTSPNQQAGAAQTYLGMDGEGDRRLPHPHRRQRDPRRIPRTPKEGTCSAPDTDCAARPAGGRPALARSRRGQITPAGPVLRTLQAAEIVGIRAFAVHAKDEEARRFDEHFDFVPSPADPMHLFILLKGIRLLVAAAQ